MAYGARESMCKCEEAFWPKLAVLMLDISATLLCVEHRMLHTGCVKDHQVALENTMAVNDIFTCLLCLLALLQPAETLSSKCALLVCRGSRGCWKLSGRTHLDAMAVSCQRSMTEIPLQWAHTPATDV